MLRSSDGGWGILTCIRVTTNAVSVPASVSHGSWLLTATLGATLTVPLRCLVSLPLLSIYLLRPVYHLLSLATLVWGWVTHVEVRYRRKAA